MCGRARCSLAREAVMSAAGDAAEQRWHDAAQYRPSYNCSPGSWIPVIKLGADGKREVQTMKWGLVPSFTKLAPGERPDHYRMFNARCEGLTQKGIFSRLLPRRRCVVLLDGFYEWQSLGGGRKQPFHITTADEQERLPAMYLAGLYDVYRDPDGEPVHTFTIITTDSSKPLAWLHDRMPVILTTPEEVSAWLGEGEGAFGGDDAPIAPPDFDTDTQGPSPSPRKPTPRPHPQGIAASPGRDETSTAHDAGAVEKTPDAAAAAAVATKVKEEDDSGGGGANAAVVLRVKEEEEGEEGGGGGTGSCSVGSGGKGRSRKGQEGGRGAGGWSEGYSALVEQICRPYGGPLLRWHPVTQEMSKPSYDKPDCCKDVRTKKGSIASFFKPAAKTTTTGTTTATTAQQPPSSPTAATAAAKSEPPGPSPLGPGLGTSAAAAGPVSGDVVRGAADAVKDEQRQHEEQVKVGSSGERAGAAGAAEALNPDDAARSAGEGEGAGGNGGGGGGGAKGVKGGAPVGVFLGSGSAGKRSRAEAGVQGLGRGGAKKKR